MQVKMEGMIQGDLSSGKPHSTWSSVCGVQMRTLRPGYTAVSTWASAYIFISTRGAPQPTSVVELQIS